MPAAHTKSCTLFVLSETYSKNIQQYFIWCNPKSTKMRNCVGAKQTICHHASWRQSVQQDRRCKVASRKAGHSFLAVHRLLISKQLDVISCPQDVCPPTDRDDKCPTSHFVCTCGHKSIKGLIAQLPHSTCPLDIFLQFHVFIPPQPLVHRRTPSGQQVKVKLTHHQLQPGSRLKGLSMVIIGISKKAAPAMRTCFLAYNFHCLKMQVSRVNSLIHPKDCRKKGWVTYQSFRRDLWFKGLDRIQVLKQKGLAVMSFLD